MTTKALPTRTFLNKTLVIDASADAIHFKPTAGGRAVIHSGCTVSEWHVGAHQGIPCWRARLADGIDSARQLFVNGRRAQRARCPLFSRSEPTFHRLRDVPGQTPDNYLFPAEEAESNVFVIDPALMNGWDSSAVEVVVLHRWTEERFPVRSFDPASGRVVSDRRGVMFMNEAGEWSRFYIENNLADLTEPGSWAYDPQAREIIYLPLPGEDPSTVESHVPLLETLVRIHGPSSPEASPVEVVFEDVTFEFTDWSQPPGGRGDILQQSLADLRKQAEEGSLPPSAGTAQAAWTVAGAVEATGAVRCTFLRCTFRNLGGWGLLLGEGCHNARISRCTFSNLGAGAIHCFGTIHEIAGRTNGGHSVEDCEIHSGGHVFPSAAAVLLRHSRDNQIQHNHIHDFLYTGISCGWVWGYNNPVARGNLIAHNRIHNLGQSWLSDMGGIYLLGEQPGTVIRQNHIHDIRAATYGAWGIYLDQGATDVLVENNLVHGPMENAFTIHFGRNNIVRHNIFAFTATGLVALGKGEPHAAARFEGNILLSGGEAFYKGGYKMDWTQFPGLECAQNLFWNQQNPEKWLADNLGAWNMVETKEGQEWQVALEKRDAAGAGVVEWLDWETWRALGKDSGSLRADPDFVNPSEGDFTLPPHSPAITLGLQRWDLRNTGPRTSPVQ